MENIISGVIEAYWEQDYMMWWEAPHFLQFKNPYKTLVEYNQHIWEHKRSCTIFAWMWCAWYNSGIDFTQDEVEKWSSRALEDWVVIENQGARFNAAVDFVRKYLNKLYNRDFVSYRVSTVWEDFKQWLENGWSFMIWYRTSSELRNDIQDDWVAREKDYPKNWWHAVRYLVYKDTNGEYVVDSYYGVIRYNIYRFEHFADLVKNNVMFPFAYILIPKEIIIMNEQLQKDIQDVKKALELWITNNKENLTNVKDWNYTDDVRTVLMCIRTYNLIKKDIENNRK